MKIRNGFVSNSSSSSFIIERFQGDNLVTKTIQVKDKRPGCWCEQWTPEDVKDWVKDEMIKYIKRKLKKAQQENNERYIQQYKNTLEEYEKHCDEELYIEPTLKCKSTDIQFWYPGYVVTTYNYILGCHCDNYIPYDICKKIIKKFNVHHYELHMG